MKFTVQDLSKAFGGHDIFKNFSLEVDSGQRLCVCGPNGTGKSTFLRMLAGVEPPDSGRVIFPKDCRLGYVEQELSPEALKTPLMDYVLAGVHDWTDFWREWDEATKSGNQGQLKSLMERQAVLEAKYGYNPEQRAREVLSGLGFDQKKWQMPLASLSGGWQERAKLAKVLTTGSDILLLDEPTNHLDMEAVEWLEDFLLSFKGALVFVAHDRVFMDRIGNCVLYLGLSKPVFKRLTYSSFLAYQEEYEAQRMREARQLQDEYERKMAFVDKFRTKATKARQASSHQKMAKKLEKQLEDYQPEQKRKELTFSWPEAPHSEKVMLSAVELAFHFPDGKAMWPPLSFNLYRGARVAIVGPNGCGKSTLLKIVARVLEKTGGSLAFAPQMRMGYYAQHQMETLRGDSTVLAEMRRLSDPRLTEEELMSVLGLFLLGQNYFERQIDSLSGGEKSRLLLASLFIRKSNFLLLDEPTNHLDLESRAALVQALKKYTGTLLIVAHDRWLLSQIDAEIWKLGPDGLTIYPDYAAWMAAKSSPDPGKAVEEEKPERAASREDQKKLKREQAEARNALHKLLKPLREEYGRLEKELEIILGRQAELEGRLADPQTYANAAEAAAFSREFEQCGRKADELMERLAALEEKINSGGGQGQAGQ